MCPAVQLLKLKYLHIHTVGEGVDIILRIFNKIIEPFLWKKKPHQTQMIIQSKVFPFISCLEGIFKDDLK